MRQLVLQHEVGMHTPSFSSSINVGDEAVTITDLRPSGKIKCNSIIYDATTSGSWITEGAKVRIMQCGMTVEVEEILS
jgi:membrane-bound ClpP family serine protease